MNDISILGIEEGGRSSFRLLRQSYYRRASGLIFVIDSNDRKRIDEARELLYQMSNEEELRNTPILIFANKQDLPNSMTFEELKDELNLYKLNKNIKCHLQLTNAIRNEGLQQGFEWLTNSMIEKFNPIKPIIETFNDATTIKNSFIIEWDYGKHGPDIWKEIYPSCAGKSQSPINIKTACTIFKYFSKFEFTSNHDQNIKFRLTNNGHVITAESDISNEFKLTGGNLNGTYRFQSFHIHWGPNHNSGSEHQINGDKSAGESHFVYNHIETNQRAVLSFLMETRSHTNHSGNLKKDSRIINMEKQWQDYFDVAQQLIHVNDSITLNLNLSVLMGNNKIDFWRYEGSLTTPPCSENVIWTVFKQKILIEDYDFERFRDKLFFESYRGPQPLYYRQIYRSFQKENLSQIPDQNYCLNKQSKATLTFNIIHNIFIYLITIFTIFYQFLIRN